MSSKDSPHTEPGKPGPTNPPRQQPSLGRVVIFTDMREREYAAIIAGVHDNGFIDLAFFRPEADHDNHVPHSADGSKPGHWHWPPRV